MLSFRCTTTSKQISKDEHMHDYHCRDVENRQVIRSGKLDGIDLVLESGNVGVNQIKKPDNIEQPQHGHRKGTLISNTSKGDKRENDCGQIAIRCWDGEAPASKTSTRSPASKSKEGEE
jgi:hypothetical protein